MLAVVNLHKHLLDICWRMLTYADKAPSCISIFSVPCQHTSTYVTVTSAYVSIRQHALRTYLDLGVVNLHKHLVRAWFQRHTCSSAYVSIRQHTSAYASMCQHTLLCVSIRAACVRPSYSMRHHTLASASITTSMRQHTYQHASENLIALKLS